MAGRGGDGPLGPPGQRSDREEQLLALRPHWLGAVPALLGVAALVLATAAGLALVPESWPTAASWAILGTGLLLLVVWPIRRLGAWVTSEFVITNERVIHRTGWLTRRQVEIPISGLTDVVFTQNVFQRPGGVGDLVLESAGGAGFIRLDSIRNAEEICRTVYDLLDSRRAPAGNSPPEPEPDSPLGQIERLAALMERGLITPEEFEAHKHRLLKKL